MGIYNPTVIADIKGGTIDNTVIGGTTPAAGTFTNLTTTGAAIAQAPVVANSGSAYTIDQANGAQFDITLNGVTPVLTLQAVTAGKAQELEVTLIQDATGSRVPSWANVTWAAGVAPTISSGATTRTYFTFISDGTTWTGYVVPLSTGTGSVVLQTAPTINSPLLAAGFSSTPVASHISTPLFGTSFTLGTAIQNTLGYDIIVNVGILVSSATTATIVMGVGPTSTPTKDTVIPSFTTAVIGLFGLTAYVPAGYYLLIDKTGTISLTNNIVVTPA